MRRPPRTRVGKPGRPFGDARKKARKREISMPTVSMTVNGRAVTGDVEGRTLPVQFLRETLHLTGTHVGCDTSQCGACVVHVGGESVKSCTMLALPADGAEVPTIEGLASKGELPPVQAERESDMEGKKGTV